MHSRPLRFLLVVACACGIAAATVFIRSLELTLTARHAALRDFDRRAREATDALAELRAAQQAYLAFGQGPDFWMAKVDATGQRVSEALATLQASTTDETSKSALDQAVAASTEFSNVDGRARGYLKNGAPLMAADIVFTEGTRAATGTSQHVEEARIEEHLALDRFETDQRKMEMSAAGGSVGFLLLMTVLLALVPGRRRVEAAAAPRGLNLSTPSAQPFVSAASADHDLPLRKAVDEERPAVKDRVVAAPTAEPEKPGRALPLQSIAQICTDMGRVGDPEELRGLLSRAAEVLDASGLVLWLGTPSGSELRPALAHGYAPDVVSRIPMVARSANNAAAAAYRSGVLQVVLSHPDSPAKGAVVAPVLAVDGCLGVLSAEIRHGGEASETVQSLAKIFAAQLAGVVASTPVAPEQAAAGRGV